MMWLSGSVNPPRLFQPPNPILSARHLFGQTQPIVQPLAIGSLGLRDQLRHLRFQKLDLLARPPVARRRMLARVGFDLRTVDRHRPHFLHTARLSSQQQHFHEGLFKHQFSFGTSAASAFLASRS
jgi:hypothetical protein